MRKYKNFYTYGSNSEKYTIKNANNVKKFWIVGAEKHNLYDEDEIIVK